MTKEWENQLQDLGLCPCGFILFPDREGILHWSGLWITLESARSLAPEIWQHRFRSACASWSLAEQEQRKEQFVAYQDAQAWLDQFHQWILGKIDYVHFPWGLSTQSAFPLSSPARKEYRSRIGVFIYEAPDIYCEKDLTAAVPEAIRQRTGEALHCIQQWRADFSPEEKESA